MKRIEAPLIFNKQINNQARGRAYGETKNVDERILRPFADIVQRNGKVVLKHSLWGWIVNNTLLAME